MKAEINGPLSGTKQTIQLFVLWLPVRKKAGCIQETGMSMNVEVEKLCSILEADGGKRPRRKQAFTKDANNINLPAAA
jgi:hypothetical protein